MNKHVCIVGAGAALALPLIEHFLSEQDRLTLIYRGYTYPDIAKSNRCLNVMGVDLPDKDDRLSLVPGNIDTLITLMGYTQNHRLGSMPNDAWDEVINDTLTSVFSALNGLLPKMTALGNVIVVGSIVGSTGGFGCSNYAAAKAGLVGLVRAAANEYVSRGICINLLELGYLNAGMGEKLDAKVKERILLTIPLRKFGDVYDFVSAVEFLSKTSYMTGEILTLAGGLR